MPISTEGRLFRWAGLFLFLYSVILTLAPTVRERSLDVDLRTTHWIGFVAWSILVYIIHKVAGRCLPDRDSILLPAASLLTGLGLLTIWRLDETFGLRQTIWYGLCIGILALTLWQKSKLDILRRYKYVLLTGGFILTGLTLIFGTNPMGFGPRLWLGCCGIYFQPSEPLKLLLVIYLSAYFADRHPSALKNWPLLLPSMLVTGIALAMMFVQRDLGTASIFAIILAGMLFLATGSLRVLLGSLTLFGLVLFSGYLSVDIIRARVNGWINPWQDPAGGSYQIIQSLLAVANGGIFGRGPGLGNPALVPVAISDFIFTAIAEETGLVGIVGLLLLMWVILSRGISASLNAPDRFRRFLSAGITLYLGIQSVLIIGGNLRLIPLTGVTLPFLSYGGSSLLTSITALGFLLVISSGEDREPAPLFNPRPYYYLLSLLATFLVGISITASWWSILRGPDLLSRTDNGRRAIADRYVRRGGIYDRNNLPINVTTGDAGSLQRAYLYPELSPIIGYTHPVYGQAGIERTMDEFLRGLRGNPLSLIWWNQLVYGTPPPGIDIRLTIDLSLQEAADRLLGLHTGAIVLMNPASGEILAMASHPAFDPNFLDTMGLDLIDDPTSPLLNRATQGNYPILDILNPIFLAKFGTINPPTPDVNRFIGDLEPTVSSLTELPVGDIPMGATISDIRMSPLHIAAAISPLSNGGRLSTPRIVQSFNSYQEDWIVFAPLPPIDSTASASHIEEAARAYALAGKPFWSHVSNASEVDPGGKWTWVIAGTIPEWGGSPIVLVSILEEDNPNLALVIRDELLSTALD